ncbi:hypothetical protein CWI84_09550 [Idiomarina tyrosinivorans]|uniref:Uncharacterized protein n=1 Tax=Idiomarina tyrosinivorans TaxID=1445662 RepID=A0A432ZPT2_9GAMM|nr:hypothetical protein [Idiomarina tyrosinivorans]RUO79861.1 hypothetical protein CWI84_09550 [Idiomarina tyrosinivorans]
MLYLLGQGFKNDKKVLLQVLLNTENETSPIGLTEGEGMAGVGGSFRPYQLLSDDKKAFLKVCDTDWLITHCEEAVKTSSSLDIKAVLESYEYLRGRKAPLVSRT